MEIVASFSLSGHVALNEIKIIQYAADGSNHSATLSDTEGLEAIKLDLKGKIVIIIHGFWASGKRVKASKCVLKFPLFQGLAIG